MQTDTLAPDATLRETREALESAVAGETARIKKNDPISMVRERLRTHAKDLSKPGTAEYIPIDLAQRRYEARAESVAERTGLTDRFNEVRSTRQAYLEARTLAHTLGYAQDDIGDLKQAYDKALFGWQEDLRRKTEGIAVLKARVEKENARRRKKNLPPSIGAGLSESEKREYREKSEIAVIAKRDVILGPAHVELEARRLALNEKGKTALGKAGIWMAKTPQAVLNLPFELIGKGVASTLHTGAPEETRDTYAKQYARASRILAGAGFATALALAASPVAATTGLLTFGVYAARGAIGTFAGVGAAKATGSIIDRFFAPKRKQELRDWLAKPATTLEEYQEQQEAYKQNNARQRSNERMGWQMVAAMLTGAGVGFGTAPGMRVALEHVGALRSVGEAAHTVAETNAHAPEVPAFKAPVAEADTVAPSASVLEVSTKPGEGFGQLLVDLRHQVEAPELKHFLDQNPNALTHALGVAENGQSLSLQPGDRLFVDSNEHVWYQAVGREPQLVFEHSADAPGGYVLKHIEGPMQPDVHHKAPLEEVSRSIPEESAVSTEDPSAALNRAQMHGIPIISAETPADGFGLGTLTQPGELDTTMPGETVAPEQMSETTPTLEPFVNNNGAEVVPAIAKVYTLPGSRLVVWGEVPFQTQIDAANAFILEQRELGKEASILLERTRENVFTGQMETTMYEYRTDTEDVKVYSPGSLPIKVFGPQDFIKPK